MAPSIKPEHRDPAYQRLRNGRPAAVAAILEDGETKELAVRAGKGKWEAVLMTARRLGAEGIECRDEAGAILEVIPLDVERKADDEPGLSSGAPLGELEVLLKLCQDFADRSTGRQQETLSAVCDTAIQVMKASADRAERSERALDKVLRAHEKLLQSRPEGDGGDMSSTDMMAWMAAMLGGKPPPQLGAGGNGQDAGELVTVPRVLVEKVQAFLKEHPEVDV